jgi:hypothetical protein
MTMEESDAAAKRSAEQALRETAQAHKGDVVEGSARPVTPRRLDQMISVRLDPDLVGKLREIAEARGVTVSTLLRDAGRMLVDQYMTPPKATPIIRMETFFTLNNQQPQMTRPDEVARTA